MTYRVRRQALTGKLILQRDGAIDIDGWHDARPQDTTAEEFHLVHPSVWRSVNDRIDRYERRAKRQRDAIARRAAAQQPANQEPQT